MGGELAGIAWDINKLGVGIIRLEVIKLKGSHEQIGK